MDGGKVGRYYWCQSFFIHGEQNARLYKRLSDAKATLTKLKNRGSEAGSYKFIDGFETIRIVQKPIDEKMNDLEEMRRAMKKLDNFLPPFSV